MTSSTTLNFARRALAVCLAAGPLALMGGLPTAHAAEGKLTILVGYNPGGGTDTQARLIGEAISATLERTVIVDNKPGAGGRIAAGALKQAPADGSVVMLAPNGLTSIQTIVYKSELKYDFAKDFAPVAKVSVTDLAIAVTADLKIGDVKALVAWLKANPGKASFASPAAGGLPHFAGLLFAKNQGIPDLLHVAYKGGSPAALAVSTGEVPMAISGIDDFINLEQAGKVKVIATMGSSRSAVSPNVPTLLEQGMKMQAAGWTAMWAPAGVPPEKLEQIAGAVRKALQSEDIKKKLAAASSTPDFAPAADLMALQRAEWELWAPVIKASGFKPGQ